MIVIPQQLIEFSLPPKPDSLGYSFASSNPCSVEMEQLADFVTKSFEYNNNGVLDIQTTMKVVSETRPSDNEANGFSAESASDEETVDVDVIDSQSDTEDSKFIPQSPTKVLQKKTIMDISNSVCSVDDKDIPVSLIKKNKMSSFLTTKNWLISDTEVSKTLPGLQGKPLDRASHSLI